MTQEPRCSWGRVQHASTSVNIPRVNKRPRRASLAAGCTTCCRYDEHERNHTTVAPRAVSASHHSLKFVRLITSALDVLCTERL